jgi:hypothetical protein
LVIDAAIPECSAGMTDSAVEVAGTMAMPNPAPANGSVHPSVEKPVCGVIYRSVRRIPTPPRKQPVIMGTRGPTAATHRPVSNEATTMTTAIGMKSTAVEYGEAPTTSWRYKATKKNMEKTPK